MTDTINQVRERAEEAVARELWKQHHQWEDYPDLADYDEMFDQCWGDYLPEARKIVAALAALSQPAPDVPSADEVEAIRRRHEVADKADGWTWAADHGPDAHQDRATLLALLDAARAELADQAAEMLLIRAQINLMKGQLAALLKAEG